MKHMIICHTADCRSERSFSLTSALIRQPCARQQNRLAPQRRSFSSTPSKTANYYLLLSSSTTFDYATNCQHEPGRSPHGKRPRESSGLPPFRKILLAFA